MKHFAMWDQIELAQKMAAFAKAECERLAALHEPEERKKFDRQASELAQAKVMGALAMGAANADLIAKRAGLSKIAVAGAFKALRRQGKIFPDRETSKSGPRIWATAGGDK